MTRPLRIYLSDLNYTNRLNRHTRHVPKNIGYVAAYAKKLFGDDIELMLFKEPQALLDAVNERKPDLLGQSFYFWNTELNHTVTKIIRERCSPDLTIVWGGPSVDVDRKEQTRLFERFPEVNAFVPNEGESGFAALLSRFLSTSQNTWTEPIDGVVHLCEGNLVRGRDVGLSLDLSELPSPYLTGLMDDFIHSDLIPGLQTSRLCPYTCSFCVSGKNRGKLRVFPMEQVEAELDFIGRIYADRPHITMCINDENFGVIRRDGEIAEYIAKTRENFNYPQSVFFYPDKKLSDTTKKVSLTLSELSPNGVTFPLQTENPDALIAAKRKAVPHESVSKAIEWASTNNLQIATEFIFGLPGETADSFAQALDEAIKRGFDTVLCNTLFIVDGIELNREKERKELGINTRFRQIRENYGMVEGQFCAEVEEVVVSTKSFDMADFLDVRKISMLFYACFNMKFHYWLVSHLKYADISIPNLMREFLDPKVSTEGPWQKFACDFEKSALGELFDSADEIRTKLKNAYIANGYEIGDAAQLNILFGTRLIYNEDTWTDDAFMTIIGNIIQEMEPEFQEICTFLMELYRRERLDMESLDIPDPIETRWDVIAWRKDKFLKPLSAYTLEKPKQISFSIKPAFLRKFESLKKDIGKDYDNNFYINIVQRIGARSDLLLQLDYV